MKRKPAALPAWTPFVRADYPWEHRATLDALGAGARTTWRNSRYQVDLEPFEHPELGRIVKIGIKDHARTARHDWRDFQRIKNELVGEGVDAIELYPAEDRLVDTANQFYLFAFLDVRVPLGWTTRLVSEGNAPPHGRQRPFEQRPPDCKSAAELAALVDRARQKLRS